MPTRQLYDDGKAGAGPWRRRRHPGSIDRAIEGVALDGYAACFANQPFKLGSWRELVGGGPSIVINLFFDNGAVKIVGAKTEGDLGHAGSQHDPIRLYVIEIIEQQARYSDGLEICEARRLGQMREAGIFGVKSQRNEGDEAAGFVLQRPQSQ